MMHGIRDLHTYFQCLECQCLQIAEIPPDMGKYYGDSYYSYRKVNFRFFSSYAIARRDSYAVMRTGLIGYSLFRLFPTRDLDFLAPLENITFDSKILDVGCGAGKLITRLRRVGFRHVEGVDPFIAADIQYSSGVKIRKRTVHESDGCYDVVMFHHSFEHIADPRETLQKTATLLSENGVCVIRIPVVPCHAWERYGVNWVQLDAPRHFFIHSRKSLEILARDSGLEIFKVTCDSTEFQFLGSELYEKDVPLASKDPAEQKIRDMMVANTALINRFAREAEKLNANGTGDQAVFYLRKRAQSHAPDR